MKNHLVLITLVGLLLITPTAAILKAQNIDHSPWNELLQKYVTSDGNVNYKGIKSNAAKLDAYLNTLSNNAPKSSWNKNERLAYWINAYNAFTIQLIIDNYPVSSITDIHNGNPWDVKWINIGDKTYSLNNIENDIIRPKFKDARIHFAVNCAAQSCPPLLNQAFTADKLDYQLDQQTKAFINNTTYNTITPNNIKLSKIFEWYAEDFGDIRTYIINYAKNPPKSKASVEFLPYNWGLNE